MVSSTGGGPDGAAEAVPASPSAADANAPAAMEVNRIFMVVPSFCSVTHDEYLLLLFMSVRHSSQRPFCAHAPLGAIVAVPADLVVSQGITVKPKPSAPDRRLRWLTNASTRLRR